MDTPFLPVCRPSITESDIACVVDVLRSGWITTGPKVAELEAQLRDLLGCRHAVTVASATAGMHLVLHHMGLRPGDEVITPSMTWVSTVNLITLCGATPVFVDIDRDTLLTDAARIESKLTDRTRLIIPVHFAGAPLDLGPLRELGRSRGIPIVEDAAHALGTRYGEEPVGRHGTAIFSFHPIKNITTGEGGVVCTDDPDLAEHLRILRFHGLGVDAFDRDRGGRAPQAEVLEPGFKYNLPDMNAVLGVSQLRRLEQINRRRGELAALYDEQLSDIDGILPLKRPDHPFHHAWHLYVIRLDTERTGMSRDVFMSELKAIGIGTGLHFRAVHVQRYYRNAQPQPSDALPNTVWNSDRLCSLPLFPDMTDSDVRRVTDAIANVLARVSP